MIWIECQSLSRNLELSQVDCQKTITRCTDRDTRFRHFHYLSLEEVTHMYPSIGICHNWQDYLRYYLYERFIKTSVSSRSLIKTNLVTPYEVPSFTVLSTRKLTRSNYRHPNSLTFALRSTSFICLITFLDPFKVHPHSSTFFGPNRHSPTSPSIQP